MSTSRQSGIRDQARLLNPLWLTTMGHMTASREVPLIGRAPSRPSSARACEFAGVAPLFRR